MKPYLYFTVFASGMTTLAVELTASRLLGPAFGTSNLVWASIIGLILIYLTVGYFIGGRWADRSPQFTTLYAILAWGAFTAGLVPMIARPVLTMAASAFDQLQVGVLFGAFIGVLLLFSLPITLLGTVSPFAIRLAITHSHEAGRISGRIYAVSTLGSFIGTFLPVLVLTPLIGTMYTFLFFSLALNLVALLGLWLAAGWKGVSRFLWMPAVLVVLAVFASGPLKRTPGQIYEAESAYNYIEVIEREGYRYLRLNEGQGVHSQWHATDLQFGGPWEQFLAAPFLNPPPFDTSHVESMAIVGLAAGTVARQASAVFGPIPIDGYEIDPAIIEVGQEYFDMNLPNLNAVAADGRVGLDRSERRYSLIGVDAYRPPYIPWHLTTQEFFQEVYDHLENDGVLAINVGRSPDDKSLIGGLVGTIASVFPSVYVMDVPGSFNSMIYATRQPTDLQNLIDNYYYLEAQGKLSPLLRMSITNAVLFQQPLPDEQVVWTDDWAPVEWITNNMVLKYVLFGDLEVLK